MLKVNDNVEIFSKEGRSYGNQHKVTKITRTNIIVEWNLNDSPANGVKFKFNKETGKEAVRSSNYKVIKV